MLCPQSHLPRPHFSLCGRQVTEQTVPHNCLCRSTCKGRASILTPPSQYSASSTKIYSSIASYAEPSMTLTSTIYFFCPCPHPVPCTDFCLSCYNFSHLSLRDIIDGIVSHQKRYIETPIPSTTERDLIRTQYLCRCN